MSQSRLPIRMADFGVLHRNKRSGALGGLTRVRRFQQDDAHIFCRPDQVKDEVIGALTFMQDVYKIFGMSFSLMRSTRPESAIGSTRTPALHFGMLPSSLCRALLMSLRYLETGRTTRVEVRSTA